MTYRILTLGLLSASCMILSPQAEAGLLGGIVKGVTSTVSSSVKSSIGSVATNPFGQIGRTALSSTGLNFGSTGLLRDIGSSYTSMTAFGSPLGLINNYASSGISSLSGFANGLNPNQLSSLANVTGISSATLAGYSPNQISSLVSQVGSFGTSGIGSSVSSLFVSGTQGAIGSLVGSNLPGVSSVSQLTNLSGLTGALASNGAAGSALDSVLGSNAGANAAGKNAQYEKFVKPAIAAASSGGSGGLGGFGNLLNGQFSVGGVTFSGGVGAGGLNGNIGGYGQSIGGNYGSGGFTTSGSNPFSGYGGTQYASGGSGGNTDYYDGGTFRTNPDSTLTYIPATNSATGYSSSLSSNPTNVAAAQNVNAVCGTLGCSRR